MDLVKLLNDLVANIAALQLQLTDAKASADALAKAKYDEGFAAGVASVPVVAGGFTQEQVDAAVATAIAPLQAKVTELQTEVDAIPAKIATEVAKIKADLLAKYEEMLVVEETAETGFKDFLK